ncbi:LOW QUALITY PROTEIN: olfactory receptor 1500-like [Boleophthalmus pectinirostris]|uniref:LOW QUALITY PROTEIN: olfactory receptor 1500-like n=1 Tax=Boleophthalmus pectinirostris TaxID=150288 RepID=UPI00242B3F0C|nr:LOW QUALITY PROTEIN: olfactory receptor 1500-like [Boleophthalmus pectinirostris]
MDSFNSALGKNITFVHPPFFIIRGFIGIPNVKYYYVFMFFVFVFSVIGNVLVMLLILMDHNLQTPKYIAVFSLAFTDFFHICALVPKLLDIFLFNHNHISYNDCMAFLFFCYACLSMEALNLMALSYDRLIAIISPLHYPIRVTHKFMSALIAFFWIFVVLVVLIAIGLLTRLSFCDSLVIKSYFCDHGQLHKLACNDTFPNQIIGSLLPVLILWFPLVFILVSYIRISFALAKIATMQERVKAFKTCSAHLSLVAIYFVPILTTFTIGSAIDPNVRIINLSLTSVVPPLLNPVIYVLQTQEIKDSVKRLIKIKRQHVITLKVVK